MKLQQQVEEEKRKHLQSAASKSKNGATANGVKDGGGKAWSYEDLQVLIKAVNLFPAGTNDRCLKLSFLSLLTGCWVASRFLGL